MSRSSYSDDYDEIWQLIMWRGTVASAIRGKRGQAFLRDLIAALDVMPEKKLIANTLKKGDAVCAIGSVGVQRGIDMSVLDPKNYNAVAQTFGIAAPMVREIEYLNDEWFGREDPEHRWQRMREWAEAKLRKEATNA